MRDCETCEHGEAVECGWKCHNCIIEKTYYNPLANCKDYKRSATKTAQIVKEACARG